MRRVVVTGMGGVTSLGQNWETVKAGLLARKNAVRRMHEWDDIEGLNAKLGAPVPDFTLPDHYTRKRIRSMGRVSLLSTRATELALEQAGLIDNPVIRSGRTGIAYGSCTGSTRAVADFGEMIVNRSTRGITATTYVQMMPHTTAVNTGLFFGITGASFRRRAPARRAPRRSAMPGRPSATALRTSWWRAAPRSSARPRSPFSTRSLLRAPAMRSRNSRRGPLTSTATVS